MTILEAKKLSIKKWEYIVQNGGSNGYLEEHVPELKEMNQDCAYCELFIDIKQVNCDGCPLNIFGYGRKSHACLHQHHPFKKWLDIDHEIIEGKSQKAAQEVLDLIKKIPVEGE